MKSLIRLLKGGQGSGNFGHEGRPGEVGGSAGESGSPIKWHGGGIPPIPEKVDPEFGAEKVTMRFLNKDDANRVARHLDKLGYMESPPTRVVPGPKQYIQTKATLYVSLVGPKTGLLYLDALKS